MKDVPNQSDHSACGVGFLCSRRGEASSEILRLGLEALKRVEHRGACSVDGESGDGAGIMTDIPWALLGIEPGQAAVASLFLSGSSAARAQAMECFRASLSYHGLSVVNERAVPVIKEALGPVALDELPEILQVCIERPEHSRTRRAFERLLYRIKQEVRTAQRRRGVVEAMSISSFSSFTIVYRALATSEGFCGFYRDLSDLNYQTRFVVFHRRFSTNTHPSWDRAQPFRTIAHNGEINTIAGNRAWSFSREQELGLPEGGLLTHSEISDSGSLNEMVEALLHRSGLSHIEDALAILIPPATRQSDFFRLWSRALEAWDGPAFVAYCDGRVVGARLDRNGFRPARWSLTKDYVFLSSEAGVFDVPCVEFEEKGSLSAGCSLTARLDDGQLEFEAPETVLDHRNADLNSMLHPLTLDSEPIIADFNYERFWVFRYDQEEVERYLDLMIQNGKEPIGSMGDTAELAVFSSGNRTFFDYFYQHFAQVTNPPVDYIREKIVADTRVFLGRKPNAFVTSELIPPLPALELDSPVIDLPQMERLIAYTKSAPGRSQIGAVVCSTVFPREWGVVDVHEYLDALCEDVVSAVRKGYSLVLLSDREASLKKLPLPPLLVLSAVAKALDQHGLRLRCSLVVESGEVRTPHHLACLVGFGASAVCPWVAFQYANRLSAVDADQLPATTRNAHLRQALESGLLRVMAKVGISVVRSYQGSRLFTALGLGRDITEKYFIGVESPIGGIGLSTLIESIKSTTVSEVPAKPNKLPSRSLFQETRRRGGGARHTMTSAAARALHKCLRAESECEQIRLYGEYCELLEAERPAQLRDLFRFKTGNQTDSILSDRGGLKRAILRTFGSGAMSFGAISAESQRDIILAMQRVGGRSNSGEGGENPFYFSDGVSASTKQIASGRFGVTGQYLVNAREIQIKIAQGAKPGEGGQLMSAKVGVDIAKARFASPGIDLISPPPMHDIYSIEDLKELIYELRQFHPGALVSVKLVAGAGIGTVAAGVAKAGADVIHIAGGSGGTGAAALTSMKHAGLPWELGLIEVDGALRSNFLREQVRLRVDGSLHRGRDVTIAALLGADQFDFGKLLLIGEGCIMARICEKNTCPTGIATHAPKFKAKYKGKVAHLERLLDLVAEEVIEDLESLGLTSLDEARGRRDLLEIDPRFREWVSERGLDLAPLLVRSKNIQYSDRSVFAADVGGLNQAILDWWLKGEKCGAWEREEFSIRNQDRAVPATLLGHLASKRHEAQDSVRSAQERPTVELALNGSAGQGFGFLMSSELRLILKGDANDSVGKSMEGGEIVILPPENSKLDPHRSAILGNVALYGATGGALFAYGRAGDRFAVRNSGAVAVAEGAGLHACEYMTGGVVVMLGAVGLNAGAGMTGGELFILDPVRERINLEYLAEVPFDQASRERVMALLARYHELTQSLIAKELMEWPERLAHHLVRFIPRNNLG